MIENVFPRPDSDNRRRRVPTTVTVNYACSDRYLVRKPGRATQISDPATFWCRRVSEKKEKRREGEFVEALSFNLFFIISCYPSLCACLD